MSLWLLITGADYLKAVDTAIMKTVQPEEQGSHSAETFPG